MRSDHDPFDKKRRGRPRLDHYSETRTYNQAIPGAVINRLNKHYGYPDLAWYKLVERCLEELQEKELFVEELEERTRTGGNIT